MKQQGTIPDGTSPEITELGGGVSNRVLQIDWQDHCLVVKQPLPNLAVEDDWPADVARVHNEAAAAQVYRQVINNIGLERTHVPGIQAEFEDDHVIVMDCAPNSATTWKSELLDGKVNRETARAVGSLLGAVHSATTADERLRAEFESKQPFYQLRIDPYHRTVAKRHSDVAEYVNEEIERVTGVNQTLVHGDYSPKNVLIATPETAICEQWVLDFEVAHWGDPAFDTAFMLNHLFIKSVYNHRRHDAYVDAALAFWDAYCEEISWDVEYETVQELAILMVARVDGKSPVEYISKSSTADALRTIGKRALTTGADSLTEFADLAGQESEQL